MNYITCPYNSRLRCVGSHQKTTCPMSMRGWMEVVMRWALTNRTPRSLDTSAVLGGINIGGSEAAAVRSANIHHLFREPEDIIGWIQAGEAGRAPITMSICLDLKRGWRRWKEFKGETGSPVG